MRVGSPDLGTAVVAFLPGLHDLLPDFAKSLVKRLGIEPATPIVSSIERLITGT